MHRPVRELATEERISGVVRSPIDFLLLEDDVALARATMRVLSPFGIVVPVHTCAEALQLLADTSPLSLVADIGLPDGNGLDVAAYAMVHRRVRRVLVMSGSVDRASLNRASDIGATYLLKPVDWTLLRRFAASVSTRVEAQVQARLAVWAQRYGLKDEHVTSLTSAALGQEIADEDTIMELLSRTGDKSLTTAVSRLYMEIHARRMPPENDEDS